MCAEPHSKLLRVWLLNWALRELLGAEWQHFPQSNKLKVIFMIAHARVRRNLVVN